MLRITDIQEGKVNWASVPYTDYDHSDIDDYKLNNGDIVFARTGATVGKSYMVDNIDCLSIYASYLIRIRPVENVYPQYIKAFFESSYYWQQISARSVGIGQPNVNGFSLRHIILPLPPLSEQVRIVNKLDRLSESIKILQFSEQQLLEYVKLCKKIIIKAAICGELTKQDANDEPAIELLKRINPDFKPCDNSHYKNIPRGWTIVPLAEILDYEQPQQYIVNSENYAKDYSIPVLTAGKTFILGNTNEKYGVCTNLPVILFDDFTTDSKYVDFPFKVKSSAVKILHPKFGINAIFISYFMSTTKLIGRTHKRYWISEYSKICIPLPPRNEQNRIVENIRQKKLILDELKQNISN